TSGCLGFGLAALLAPTCSPAFAFLLRRTGERKRVRRDVLGDHAARSDIGTRADLGAMLGEAVVVAGDGSRPDIGARADASIADIGEMVDLGALADLSLLDLDEIADMSILAERGAGAEPRERPDDCAGTDMGAFDMGEASDGGAVLDNHAWTNHDVRLDHHVPADARVMADEHRLGRN